MACADREENRARDSLRRDERRVHACRVVPWLIADQLVVARREFERRTPQPYYLSVYSHSTAPHPFHANRIFSPCHVHRLHIAPHECRETGRVKINAKNAADNALQVTKGTACLLLPGDILDFSRLPELALWKLTPPSLSDCVAQ
ncbi:hypothetical protein [Paraburkholderia sp. J7]|uniref:hypothetical protein n=1 Tax=Paraburkholderia sp. J7 TaxID=2805438 RepID=UPI002AB77B75|nr:hypothetical protein [Paraburkholderia sp. J7]